MYTISMVKPQAKTQDKTKIENHTTDEEVYNKIE